MWPSSFYASQFLNLRFSIFSANLQSGIGLYGHILNACSALSMTTLLGRKEQIQTLEEEDERTYESHPADSS